MFDAEKAAIVLGYLNVELRELTTAVAGAARRALRVLPLNAVAIDQVTLYCRRTMTRA